MNPLAFEPTDMDIVALCDNVSCDVENMFKAPMSNEMNQYMIRNSLPIYRHSRHSSDNRYYRKSRD